MNKIAADRAAWQDLLGGFFRIRKSEVLDMSLTDCNKGVGAVTNLCQGLSPQKNPKSL